MKSSSLKNLPVLAAAAAALALPLRAQHADPAHAAHAALAPAASAGPIGAIHAHVCGFHFYSGEPRRALRVEHYCSHVNPDVFQCVIYDSAAANARLIGVEYIISEARFRQLPAEEKQLWHSHRYEVLSGLLTAPDLTGAAEEELMLELLNTYGKTWHLWQVDRGDALPLGLPKLMLGFTADGQLAPGLVEARDRAAPGATGRTKARRAAFPARPVAEGADAWQHGPPFQLRDAWLPAGPAAPERR